MAHSSLFVTYLMLVSFMTPVLSDLQVTKVRMLNQAPFHGVAAMVKDAYSTEKINEREFEASVRSLRLRCKKDVWPWVFFNRFIGYRKGDEAAPPVDGTPAGALFSPIKGMDLYNEAGALGDFYNTWEVALRLARKLGSPGIIVDAEAYNNYITADLAYLAHLIGRPVEEVRPRLEDIGAQLVDLADRTYPGATIWLLFTELGKHRTPRSSVGKLSLKKYYASCTYIIIGMLERAKNKGSKLTFISGGEGGLGYCHHSIETMEKRIQKRNKRFAAFLTSYPNLHLAGTIALWDRAETKTGFFLTNRECRYSTIKTIDDFEPLLIKLFSRYRYNWIYASSWWNPYEMRVSAIYEGMLRRALIRVGDWRKE